MTAIATTGVARWHAVFELNDEARMLDGLNDLLHDEVVFHSPALHRPVEGKLATAFYLRAASTVLVTPHWRYVREVIDGNHAVLEFITEVEGITINGVDMVTFDDEGKIVDFKVMVRPFRALEKLKAMMVAAMNAA